MALILNLETASKNCSVSISKDGETIALKELISEGYSHAEMLHPFIEEVIATSGYTLDQIQAVAVSMGPGSYTGLRIGVSAAKGICFSKDLPLISVSTLESMAFGQKNENKYLVPMLDARRMEVYSSVFDRNLNEVRETKAEIIDENSFGELLIKEQVLFFGDGALKCKPFIQSKNAFFKDGIFPSANEMAVISEKKFNDGNFEDVAYFEPFYLKDFVVTKSLKN